MKAFADLYRELDAATSTKRKQFALQSYLRAASTDPSAYGSAAWTVYFLAGGKPRQFVSTRVMREVSLDLCDLPEWLFEECRETVGDFAETLSLLLPTPQAQEEISLAEWIGSRLPSLRPMKDAERAATLRGWIDVMPQEQRLVFFKLITGSLRVGVSKLNVVNALASVSGVDARTMAQRMMGFTQTARGLHGEDFAALLNPGEDGWRSTQPYPFFLAHPLQAPVEALDELLGPPAAWLVEWKFDGIRAQLLRRGGEWRLWSRGEELVNDAFPELGEIASRLPDGTALDGEIVVGKPRDAPVAQVDAIDDIAPFASLQRRLGRKALSAKILHDLPAHFIAYDLLEMGGEDLRERPQAERRKALEALRRAPLPQRGGARRRAAATPQSRHSRRKLGGAVLAARNRPRRRRRGNDVEAARGALWRRAAQGCSRRALVEVEARSDERRRGHDLCAARPWASFRRL